MTVEPVLAAHLAVTAFLCGLIWVVQVVHYPLFDLADRSRFVAFEAAHQRRITWVVGPAMLLEFATAVAWAVLAWRTDGLVGWAAANVGLILVVWVSTALLAVPQHTILARGFDARAHRRLVDTNWVRTVVWTLRTVGLVLVVVRSSGGAL